MATRKKPLQEKDPNAPSLKEILSDNSNSVSDSYNLVDPISTIRLIYCVTALGGMVTFWHDSVNERLCFSLRLWGEARSYNVEHASQFPGVSESVVGKLVKVMQSQKKAPPVPPASTPPVKPE
jgi:hypothetical protein